MKHVSFYLTLFALAGWAGVARAQEIAGRILDNTNQPVASAELRVFQGKTLKGGYISDMDGQFVIRPLAPGYYDVLMTYPGYDSTMVTGVLVTHGERTIQNFSMPTHVVVKSYRKPLTGPEKPSTVLTPGQLSIRGCILDNTKQPVVNAMVWVLQGKVLKGSAVSDFDGRYVIKPLDPGNYDVIAAYPGYDSMIVTGVVTPGDSTTLNLNMQVQAVELKGITIIQFKKPPINRNPIGATLTREKYLSEVPDVVSSPPGVYQNQRSSILKADTTRKPRTHADTLMKKE